MGFRSWLPSETISEGEKAIIEESWDVMQLFCISKVWTVTKLIPRCVNQINHLNCLPHSSYLIDVSRCFRFGLRPWHRPAGHCPTRRHGIWVLLLSHWCKVWLKHQSMVELLVCVPAYFFLFHTIITSACKCSPTLIPSHIRIRLFRMNSQKLIT